jgi:hypothetical protein
MYRFEGYEDQYNRAPLEWYMGVILNEKKEGHL